MRVARAQASPLPLPLPLIRTTQSHTLRTVSHTFLPLPLVRTTHSHAHSHEHSHSHAHSHAHSHSHATRCTHTARITPGVQPLPPPTHANPPRPSHTHASPPPAPPPPSLTLRPCARALPRHHPSCPLSLPLSEGGKAHRLPPLSSSLHTALQPHIDHPSVPLPFTGTTRHR